ncbi:hypothetical protein Plhal703r1_c14g0071071 [Plasmopara halstedii]
MTVADAAIDTPTSPKLDLVRRKLDMTDAEDEDSDPPTVHELMQEVNRLQHRIGDDQSIFAEDCSLERTLPRYIPKMYTTSKAPEHLLRPGIYPGRTIASNVGNISPYKNVGAMARSEFGLMTPPSKRRDIVTPTRPRTAPRPTRVAALTRENISLLPKPRAQIYTGSVCGSQISRTSIRTDGGAVFSRLYQPDFYKNRDEKLKNMRDRRESLDCSFTPHTNRRGSTSPRGSIGSGSQASMISSKTDVVNVSSRLYDPDYVRKRSARLQRMRQEREMRGCTFTPTINSTTTCKKL